jgi:enoyl-CoA hydratase/carnithine racemase
MPETFNVRTEGRVEIIEFDNPPMNFIDLRMLRELREELVRVRGDDGVRVLVLTGGMKDSFLTHFDVPSLIEYSEKSRMRATSLLSAAAVHALVKLMNRFPALESRVLAMTEGQSPGEQGIMLWGSCIEHLDTMPKPVIAAINGLSLGGGCEISLCCDFRYMARGEAYVIGLPEVTIGIIPGGTGSPFRLSRIVGEATALEMLLTGKIYSADQAQAIGLIHGALDPEELMPVVMELAERLARGAPLAQRAIKTDVRKGSRLSYLMGRITDLAVASRAVFSEDARTGMKRYVEILSGHESFDPKAALADAEKLLDGREVEYRGR